MTTPEIQPTLLTRSAVTVRSKRKAPRTAGQRWGRGGLYLILLVWSLFTVIPLLWSVAASFTPQNQIFANLTPFTWRALFPENVTLDAYKTLLSNDNFLRALLNTFFLCFVNVVGGLAVNSLAGFAFTFFEFPGKRVLMALVFVSFLVPFDAIVIPLYSIASGIGLTNSFQALILPVLASGGLVFMFRQFFTDTPKELIEAARIDGLSWFGIYARVVLPLSIPVLISAGLFLFLVQWESYFWPLLVANRPEYQVVQVAIANFNTQYITRWDVQLAGSVFTLILPTILLAFLQRYYVASQAASGSKE